MSRTPTAGPCPHWVDQSPAGRGDESSTNPWICVSAGGHHSDSHTLVCFEASNMFCCIWVDSSYQLLFNNPTWRQCPSDIMGILHCHVWRQGIHCPFVYSPFFYSEKKKHIIVALTSIVRLIFLCWVKPLFIVQGPMLNGRGRRNHHFLCCFNMLKALQRSRLKHFAYLKNSLIIPQKDNTQII